MSKTNNIPAGKKSPTIKTITLHDPLEYGDKTIESFDIRRPNAGELRGIKLLHLAQMDTDELLDVLPRITSPVLAADQAAMLTARDTHLVFNELLDFFQQG